MSSERQSAAAWLGAALGTSSFCGNIERHGMISSPTFHEASKGLLEVNIRPVGVWWSHAGDCHCWVFMFQGVVSKRHNTVAHMAAAVTASSARLWVWERRVNETGCEWLVVDDTGTARPLKEAEASK